MNNDNPKISIIVPTYNCVEYVPKCVGNILKQDYTNWELILVNGRSKDGTTELCDKYASEDDRIMSIHDIDGLVPARNVGYDHATGDWIMYIDGDDWIDEDALETLVDATKRYDNIDVVFYNYIQNFNGKDIQKWHWECGEPERLYTGKECIDLSYKVFYYKLGISEAYNKIVRKDFADKYELKHNSNLRQGIEGSDYSMRVYFYAKRMLFISRSIYHYRYNPTSLAHVVDEKDAYYISDGFHEVQKFIDSTVPVEYKAKFKKALNERCLYGLIAKALSSFFNPRSKNSHRVRCEHFEGYIDHSKEIQDAIRDTNFKQFDKFRRFVLNAIVNKQYRKIEFVSWVKEFMKIYLLHIN